MKLAFDFANIFAMNFPVSILPDSRLFIAYGNKEEFQEFPLEEGIQNGVDAWVATLPATDEEGLSLRYYRDSLPV